MSVSPSKKEPLMKDLSARGINSWQIGHVRESSSKSALLLNAQPL